MFTSTINKHTKYQIQKSLYYKVLFTIFQEKQSPRDKKRQLADSKKKKALHF